MPTTIIGGREIHVDRAGYLTEFGEWDDELADRLATAMGVALTDDHWRVLSFAREDYLAQGRPPSLHRIAVATGMSPLRLVNLFLERPLWTIKHLAGLPAPARPAWTRGQEER